MAGRGWGTRRCFETTARTAEAPRRFYGEIFGIRDEMRYELEKSASPSNVRCGGEGAGRDGGGADESVRDGQRAVSRLSESRDGGDPDDAGNVRLGVDGGVAMMCTSCGYTGTGFTEARTHDANGAEVAVGYKCPRCGAV